MTAQTTTIASNIIDPSTLEIDPEDVEMQLALSVLGLQQLFSSATKDCVSFSGNEDDPDGLYEATSPNETELPIFVAVNVLPQELNPKTPSLKEGETKNLGIEWRISNISMAKPDVPFTVTQTTTYHKLAPMSFGKAKLMLPKPFHKEEEIQVTLPELLSIIFNSAKSLLPPKLQNKLEKYMTTNEIPVPTAP